MINHRQLGSVLAVGLAVLVTTACSGDDNVIAGTSLVVDNQSDFTITEVHLVPVGSSTFGDNLLRGQVLLPGQSLLLGIPCDTYDAQVTDEQGVNCELRSIDLCLNNATWVILNTTCAVFGAAKQQDALATGSTAATQLLK